jgi:Cu(I)/Ag(I) efflux system membrane protein CusA/SilA
MRRIAAPMVGGMVSATVLTLVIIPSLYLIINGWRLDATSDDAKEFVGG